MMRWSGSGVIRWTCIGALGILALAGCTRRAAVSTATPAPPPAAPIVGEPQQLTETSVASSGEAPSATLSVREIKVIDDNGQQGVFVKLSGPPTSLNHYTLAQPTRLVVDIAGAASNGDTAAQKFAVQNPLISEIRLSHHEGNIRLTVQLKADSAPAYTVNDLNDTVVAFLGEPSGTNQPVHEQVVFTRRAVETARREVPPSAAASSPAATQPRAPSKTQSAQTARSSAADKDPDSQADAKGPAHQLYLGQHVSLDFKDADVHNVLRLLAEVSKLNIVATDDVHGKVTLRLFDVPWDQALDVVLQVLNLESEQNGNVIRISTVRRLREEREELQKAQEAARAVEPLHVDYMKVNYAKASKLADIISGAARSRSVTQGSTTTRRTEEDGVLSARGSVFVDEFTNTLIVRDIQRGIDNAREVVRRLDVQAPQVLIESNIVEATTDFSRDLGIQWGYHSSIGPQTGQLTGVNFPGSIGLGGSGLGVGGNGVPFIADFPAAVVPGGGSAIDLALGSIDGSQSLDLRLSALETEGKAHIISRPRVVTLNNVAATIKSLTIIRVKLPSTGTVINTGAGGAAGSASTATEKIETGIILVVTPQISGDGFVLLDMFAKSSQADFTRTVDQIPTEISREANSHILIKDGQTVVLGGIYRDTHDQHQTGIPYLKDIPALGWLFRDFNKSARREDLLVFLTPRIMGGAHAELPSAEDLWTHRN